MARVRRAETHLGHLCAQGHDHENTGRSLRYSTGNRCVECARVKNLRWYEKRESQLIALIASYRSKNAELLRKIEEFRK